MRWQSQPRQSLNDRRVQAWINHDSDLNSIHLFLRTAIRRAGTPAPFTYLGELEYLGHDPGREMPVYFSWRLKNWPISIDVRERIKLILENRTLQSWEGMTQSNESNRAQWNLVRALAPSGNSTSTTRRAKSRTYTPRLDINFELQSARARRLGALGEELVVRNEKQQLVKSGRADLAKKVKHVAKERGDGAGYDVLSFSEDGSEVFIEVKTTTHGPRTEFILTANEVAFSSDHEDRYRLYRLYHFDEKSMTADFFVIEGDLTNRLNLLPTVFRAVGW